MIERIDERPESGTHRPDVASVFTEPAYEFLSQAAATLTTEIKASSGTGSAASLTDEQKQRLLDLIGSLDDVG